MADPAPVTQAEAQRPPARPLELTARLDRSAGRNGAYLEELGRAAGRRLIYGDAAAFVWWSPGGRLTLNRGKRGLIGTTRGLEDAGGRSA